VGASDSVGSIFGLDEETGGPVEFGEENSVCASEGEAGTARRQAEDREADVWASLEVVDTAMTVWYGGGAVDAYRGDSSLVGEGFQPVKHREMRSKDDHGCFQVSSQDHIDSRLRDETSILCCEKWGSWTKAQA